MPEQYPDLIPLSGYDFPVHVSSGCEEHAYAMAAMCQKAHRFLARTLRAQADITVLVLAPPHWPQYAAHPTYGMPHAAPDGQVLIMPGQSNPFWQSMIPTLETLSPQREAAARAVYGLPDGSLDLSPFFNLLSIHELAHLFHAQANVQFPRKWLQEFFANLSLHTYVAKQEPGQLSALETFPSMVVEAGSTAYVYHALADFDRLYARVGPQNYGWYQCRLHVAAKAVFDAGGVGALQRLWRAFAPISDDQLTQILDRVHPRLGLVFTGWST